MAGWLGRTRPGRPLLLLLHAVAACAARAAPSSLEKSITTSASPALTCSSSSRSIAWMIWHPRSAGMLAAMR
jgi:hypothetical protein